MVDGVAVRLCSFDAERKPVYCGIAHCLTVTLWDGTLIGVSTMLKKSLDVDPTHHRNRVCKYSLEPRAEYRT